MKIRNLFTLVLCLCTCLVFGQDLKVTATGIGINTPTPTKMLEITSNQDFVVQANGGAGIARLGVNSSAATNSGLGISTFGVRNYSIAAYQAGAGNIDFTFWNDQTGSEALGLDGDTNNANFSGTVSSQGSLLTSDARLKKDIKEYNNGLETVMRIKPVTFSYNKTINRNMTNRKFVGVLAQELQKIDPSLVSTFTHTEIDENMKQTGKKTEYLQIQSDALQYLLINAIKDQQKIISSLENRIKVLEQKK